MQKHQWRERVEDGTIIYSAAHHAKRWSFSHQMKGDEEFEPLPEELLTQEVWEALRDVLWNKYRRGRCAYKIVVSVDKHLEKEYGIEPPHQD